jgi:hypothetical protein
MTSRTWSNNFPLGLGTSIGRFSLDAFFISSTNPPLSLNRWSEKGKQNIQPARTFQYPIVLDGILDVQTRPVYDAFAGFNIRLFGSLNDLLDKAKTLNYDPDMDANIPSFSTLKKEC